jgi:hypothetical protein
MTLARGCSDGASISCAFRALLSEYLLFETIALMLNPWMTPTFFLAMGEQWGPRTLSIDAGV